MKILITYLSFLGLLLASNCTGQQATQNTNWNLTPSAFAQKCSENGNAGIIDVRTAEEFAGGHLSNALNIDWTADNFEQLVAAIDPSKPVFLYCLSGARSASAAQKLRELGFKEVYELDGGLLGWRAQNLPETRQEKTNSSTGLDQAGFEALLQSDKLVLVDFYAEWCGPCQKMKPYLDEIATELKSKVVLVRIDTDKNPELCKSLGIDAIPVLQLYKNKKLLWKNMGFIEKDALVAQVNKQIN